MYQLRESNALVEEFMLLANITVSKKILRHFPTLAVLRRHQPPSKEQFSSLLSAANAVGVRIDISSSKVSTLISLNDYWVAYYCIDRHLLILWTRQRGLKIHTSTNFFGYYLPVA
jgi:RNB domain